MTDYVPDAPCVSGDTYGPGECTMETIQPQPAAPTVPELPSTGIDPFLAAGVAVIMMMVGFAGSAMYQRRKPRCQRPPRGWRCSRTPNHDGPCAATRKGLFRGRR